MFHTYREVLLPSKRHAPSIRLSQHLTKDVGVVVYDALEPRLMVQVQESRPVDLVLHLHHSVLKPFITPEELLHINIM
jgi:hypothetical protein